MSAFDMQVGGNHYKKMKIQTTEFCMANELDHCQSNIIKYVCRHADKGGLEDLVKAKHYLQILIECRYPLPKKEESFKGSVNGVPYATWSGLLSTKQPHSSPWKLGI
jgi:hypothetical protein